MTSRYANTQIILNGADMYKKLFNKRNVKLIEQYATPQLVYPDVNDILELTVIYHTWKTGDRYFKLANQYYQDPALWWVIAWFNEKPTEHHVEYGENIAIPLPLEKILGFFEV